jgi:hypothetical protein
MSMKKNVLIIGAGGVAHVAAHKTAMNNELLGDICLASRTLVWLRERWPNVMALSKASNGKGISRIPPTNCIHGKLMRSTFPLPSS